ncbi:MAG: heme-binding protein [Deltaproteobacteria bacterium]|nr:heme-binding protein [Deltaproteobacteria bacterium]
MKYLVTVIGTLCAVSLLATTPVMAINCDGLPTKSDLQSLLIAAPSAGGEAGGLFHGTQMWGAVVNRNGELCAFITSTADPTQTWPGSQAIAKAKAYTANAFSNDGLALSTARLYTFSQPGHSLFGLNNSNPFDPKSLAQPGGSGVNGKIAGGIITFGGGVPLYKSGKIIGGLGISGDTACADHEIAKRVRSLAILNPPGGASVDDITYSSADGTSVFTHPLCPNTWRNGTFIGNELPASGY